MIRDALDAIILALCELILLPLEFATEAGPDWFEAWRMESWNRASAAQAREKE